MRKYNRLSVIVTRLLILSIFLCCLVAGSFLYFITVERVRIPYMPKYDLPKENIIVELDTHIALEYPLFWETRRPIPELDAPKILPVQIQAGSITGVKLIGVILKKSVRIALLEIDKKIKKVIKGDDVNGWLVIQVFTDKIVLVANGQTRELSITRERPHSIKLEPLMP